MNKRNEKSKLTKPELIDVVKIIDWTVDVSPVELCQAINRAGNYKAQHKYHAGEKKFYDLVNGYDAKLLSSGVVLIKKQGKDKFYSLKPGVSKNTLLELLGGEPVVEEKKPEVTMPTTEVVEIPVVAEEPKKKRIARELGDNESTLKAILVLKAISLSEKGIVLTETMTKLRKEIGWNRQRYINKKYMTIYQEAEEVIKSYFGVSIVVGKRSLSFSGDTNEIPKYISELTGLITSMSDHEKQIMEKINNLTPVPVPAPEKEEEKKEVKEEREKSSYTPTKDFSEILSSFSEKERRRREEDTVEAPSPAVFFQEPENDSFFLEENEDNKVSSDVVWSIVGGANKDYVRKETEEKKEEEKEETETRRVSKPFEPKHSFSTVLSSYEKKKDKVPEKTFEEILKEKGDGKVKRRTFTFTELKRMDPQATLDLHGETQKDSEVKVREFLSSSLSNGLRKISIITGKGLHSEDGQGVLREVAEGVLRESDAVSDISNAPLSKGGSGALWVVLKEKKD